MSELQRYIPIPSRPPIGEELRVEPRYPVSPGADWRTVLTSQTRVVPTEVRNLSLRGVGLVVEQDLPEGIIATIELASESGLFQVRPRIQVVHVTRLTAGGFLVGCRFLAPLTYDQVRSLLR